MRLFHEILVFFILLLPAWLIGSETDNNQFNFSIKPGLDYIFGHTLYSIGYTGINPDGSYYNYNQTISQMKFYINNLYATGTASAEWQGLKLECSLKKSVFADTQQTEDSDWGYFYFFRGYNTDPSTLDVFSTSDTTMDGWMFEARLIYKVFTDSFFKLSCGIGFSWSAFSFTMSNLDQYYPSYNTYINSVPSGYGGHVYVSGTVGTYNVTNISPLCFIFKPEINLFDQSLELSGSLILSPFTSVDNVDNHILVGKLCVAHDDGFMFHAEGSALYHFSPSFSLEFIIAYETLQASGMQKQTQYETTSQAMAGPLGSISQTVETEYLSVGIKTGFNF